MNATTISPPARAPQRSGYDTVGPTSPHRCRPFSCAGGAAKQQLRIVLAGITAGDYITWVLDPEPPMLGRDLRSVTVSAEELGEQIDIQLCWNGPAPPPTAAAIAAGFTLTPEVAQLHDIDQPPHPPTTKDTP